MGKRFSLILIIFVLLTLSSAACDSRAKVIKRNTEGTPTLTPFSAKATYTVTNTPMKTNRNENNTDLTLTITSDPVFTIQTSEVTITGEVTATPSLTETPGYSSPTVATVEVAGTPSATMKPAEPTHTATSKFPSATPKPGEPSATAEPTKTPSDTPEKSSITDTPIPPAATYTPEPPAATSTPAGCNISGNAGYESQVVTLINKERTDRGLGTLSNNSSLRAAARWHSEDMACNDFFSHTGSDSSTLSSRILAAGYGYSWAAENIAASSNCSFSAQSVVNMWMNSSGHKANILSPNAVHIGVGFRCANDGISGDLDAYYTADFGRP